MVAASHTRTRRNRTLTTLYAIALVLVIVRGIDRGLVGLFDVDLVAATFGIDGALSDVVQIPVGLAALYAIVLIRKVTAPGVEDARYV